ncbi:extracellular catalytic domain type 1 short-chain-length polyhydroxyalkanoate depolymerase [Paractinoplanes durhamensis]|nr:PHB depolymerase family esterase [Actinoplanes durhamensis]
MLRAALAGVAAASVAVAAALVTAQEAQAASLVRVTSFGTNPSNLNMYVYVPDRVAAKPALLVAMHYCTGSASAVANGQFKDYETAADQYGFIIVFPEATRSGQCFDVYSAQALKRGGGSDPVGIMSMVDYAKSHYNVDPARVFATGTSSGAMMTNVMLADYPDVFAGGSAFMGVPATCFATTGGSTWNSQCSGGQISKTAQQWGDAARAMDPGYTGAYPRMQVWHGTTDTTLNYNNFGEEIKQWTNLSGVGQTPAQTDTPRSGWTRTGYGNNGLQPPVEGISVAGVGHSLPTSGMIAYAVAFLGLDNPGGGSTSSPSQSPTPSSPPAGGSCTATITPGTVWADRYNTSVTVTGSDNWTVVIAITSPQKVSTTWSGAFSWSGGGYTMSVKPNGSGNTFGFTTMTNGNTSARPRVTSCTTG